MNKLHFFKGLAFILFFIGLSPGCGYSKVPYTLIEDADISALPGKGFTLVGAQKILEMQQMKRANGICKGRENVCGLAAGISAGFMLNPREAFYDVANPPLFVSFGDGQTDYDKLGNSYPTMRPKLAKEFDLGLLPDTLATFWSKSFKHHNAEPVGFDSRDSLLSHAQSEISGGRPVLALIRLDSDYPLYLPDQHLGLRGFNNQHWVVLAGYSQNEWLIRDDGAMKSFILQRQNNNGSFTEPKLITISKETLINLLNLETFSEEVKLYLSEPNLPTFLDDWQGDGSHQLKRDFENIKPYNLIQFRTK